MRKYIDPLTEKKHWDTNWQGNNLRDLSYRIELRWLRRYLYSKMDEIFAASLPNGPRTFFEVGCGGGKWLVYFGKRFGYSVSGIDYSESGVLEASRSVSLAGMKADVIHGDIFSARLKNSYDVVLSDGFLEHFDNTAETLSYMAAHVRKGGHLITIVPNLTGFQKFLLSLFNHEREVFQTHKPLTKEQLVGAYKASRFTKIRFYEIGSVIPKTFAVPGIVSKTLNILLRVADIVGIDIEGEKISNTYLVMGKRDSTLSL